ncbi:MAG: hypothetical protein J0I25_14560 [Sphingomonadales bacterium]|nr:hypothetical protein [Sphingomonadales bacterium]
MKTEISTPPKTAANQTAQRVRVGMVGLAAVVLLIGLASAIFSAASHEKPVATIDAPKAEAVANMTLANNTVAAPTAPNEPLAELGVAPATTNGAAPAAPHH